MENNEFNNKDSGNLNNSNTENRKPKKVLAFFSVIIFVVAISIVYFFCFSKIFDNNSDDCLSHADYIEESAWRYEASKIRHMIEWYKLRSLEQNVFSKSDISKLDNGCIEILKEKNNIEFIDLVQNYDALNLALGDINKEKWNNTISIVNDYFKCNFLQENWKNWDLSGDLSEEAKFSIDFINNLSISDVDKMYYKENLYTAINSGKSIKLLPNLAFGNLDYICSEKFRVLCIKALSYKNENPGRALGVDCENKSICDYICEEFQETERGSDFYTNNILGLMRREVDCSKSPHEVSWLPRPKIVDNIRPEHIAFLYRFGGEEMALNICDNIINPYEKSECELYVKGVAIFLDDYKVDCDSYIQTAKEMLCESE